MTYRQDVPVVQWIEYRIPVPTIRVRLPTGIPINDRRARSYKDSGSSVSFVLMLSFVSGIPAECAGEYGVGVD